mmetsp:Transcript_30285/g.37410  ORF Transcript_30285/g.37410 Transcript_30285/m.37410 type:complete len:231 (-) Transcript_30285:1876-2568(-)
MVTTRRSEGTRSCQPKTNPKGKKRGRTSIATATSSPDGGNENERSRSNVTVAMTRKRKRAKTEEKEKEELEPLLFPSCEGETEIIGRESEKDQIHNFMKECMSNRVGASLYICGSAGTGKTACVTETLDYIENGLPNGSPRTKIARVNGNTYNSPEKIYNALLQQLFDFKMEESYSAENARVQLSKKFIPTRKRKATTMYIIMVDEIDQLITTEQEVLYQLFEWPALPSS